MYILGLNAFHGDSSACIYKNGKLIAASEEERFRRIKHWAGFPTEAIRFCLNEAGIDLTEVDYVTISRNPRAKIIQKVIHVLKNRVTPKTVADRLSNARNINAVKDWLSDSFSISKNKLKAEVIYVEHHRSHMASAFFASPFEESAILSVDGFGDFSSTMIGVGKGTKLSVIDSVSFPHSIGIFYGTLTEFLGFPNYGDEYKVMGLAPYGKPALVEKVRDLFIPEKDGMFKLNMKYFLHHKHGVAMNWSNGQPHIDLEFSPELIRIFGEPRGKNDPLTDYHRDLAASVQQVCEELIFHLLNTLYKKTGLKNLCVAGGVAQNSVANGKILKNTPFENIYIPPAGHDAGTAIGSALYHYCHNLGHKPEEVQQHSYFGSRFENVAIQQFLNERSVAHRNLSDAELFNTVSDCIINGGVVGWFQGRAEFGPRALGHRSIIADPRRADAKEILNLKIKRRENFRPFAPSILKESVSDYFEYVDDVPFMEKVFIIKKAMREKIPAVTHVDGTGRLQTVNKSVEPKYYGLIETFYRKTGVPILLNTSFNENEPIVNTPAEALDCFLRTKMDMLVMENCVIER